MTVLSGLCIVLGILCLAYYGFILLYAGLSTSFAWIWLLSGVGCLVVSILLRYMLTNDLRITGIWKLLITLVVILGFGIFTLLEGMLIYHSTKKADDNADYLIVLGAQVKGTTISKALKKRLDTAVLYLLENPNTFVIVSGGKGPGEDISEAEAMKQYLLGKGMKERQIIKEDRSTSTNENIRYSKELLVKEKAKVVIVTNGFHIFRSLSIAKKQGLMAQGLAAPTDQFLILHYYIREAAGVLKDFVLGNF